MINPWLLSCDQIIVYIIPISNESISRFHIQKYLHGFEEMADSSSKIKPFCKIMNHSEKELLHC